MVNLHIIGVQKGGTTALSSFLDEHPDIFLLKNKEAHVFDDPAFLRATHKMQFAKNKYKTLSTDYQGQKYTLDATPITLFNPVFLAHCYRYNPNAKFIVVLRDPVERAISHYQMSFVRKQEAKNMLLSFLFEQLRLQKHTSDWRFTSPMRTQSYLSRGLYSTQLNSLFQTIPANQVLVLYNQDLREQHEETMNKIFSFLELTKHKTKAREIFKGESLPNTLINRLAKQYAKAYFKIKKENRRSWDTIIQNAQTLGDA